jgi:hypothetical protein
MTQIKDCDHFLEEKNGKVGLKTIEGKMLYEFGFGNVNSIKYSLQFF